MNERLRHRISNIHNGSRKIYLEYILKVIEDRRFEPHTNRAILNYFSQIINSDIDLKEYFENLLTDCFDKKSKQYHLRLFI